MAKTKKNVDSAKICRRILATKDVVKDSLITTLVESGFSKEKIKKLETKMDAVLVVQFNSLVDATQSELD